MATTNQFKPAVIVGRGFMAISAVIFGKFTPHGAMLACMLFGLCSGVKVLAGNKQYYFPELNFHDSVYCNNSGTCIVCRKGKEFRLQTEAIYQI